MLTEKGFVPGSVVTAFRLLHEDGELAGFSFVDSDFLGCSLEITHVAFVERVDHLEAFLASRDSLNVRLPLLEKQIDVGRDRLGRVDGHRADPRRSYRLRIDCGLGGGGMVCGRCHAGDKRGRLCRPWLEASRFVRCDRHRGRLLLRHRLARVG